jgi:monoamine oxidase
LFDDCIRRELPSYVSRSYENYPYSKGKRNMAKRFYVVSENLIDRVYLATEECDTELALELIEEMKDYEFKLPQET